MQRNEVNAISEEVMGILEAAQAEGKLQGYDIARGSGRFGEHGFDMKISITPQRTDADRADAAKRCSPDALRYGLAPAGTPVTCRIKGGATQRGEIVRARRSRYLVKGIGGKYDGQEFTYPFNACKLDAPDTANA